MNALVLAQRAAKEGLMLAEMKNIAEECVKHPGRPSLWSDQLGRYVCPDVATEAATAPLAQSSPGISVPYTGQSSLNPAFKLVFVTAAGGTFLFTLLCVVLHLSTGGAPPPLMEKFIDGLFDLVKIGFGAMVGLLGGKALDHMDHR